jgi:hypothetical protein
VAYNICPLAAVMVAFWQIYHVPGIVSLASIVAEIKKAGEFG